MQYNFMNDYNECAHERILEAIARANREQDDSYGLDAHCERARALILDPKIVVCDEPVSALDVSIQSQIINLLKELQRKRGLTYLFVAHDMSVIRDISDRVGVMYLGHLVEEGDTDEVFDHPQHPYTRTLMSAVPSIDPRDNRQRILLEGDLPSPIDPPSGCVFHTRCPWATEACKTASCELREVRKGHYAACSRGEQE